MDLYDFQINVHLKNPPPPGILFGKLVVYQSGIFLLHLDNLLLEAAQVGEPWVSPWVKVTLLRAENTEDDIRHAL